ncbi:hypothetical protein Emag_001163 [Eimeria magna]
MRASSAAFAGDPSEGAPLLGAPSVMVAAPKDGPESEGVPTGAPPLPRLVVKPLRPGELLQPFGRQRRMQDSLFLKNVRKPRQTLADAEDGTLSPAKGSEGGPPPHSPEGPPRAGLTVTPRGPPSTPPPARRRHTAAAAADSRHATLSEAAASAGSSIILRGPSRGPFEEGPPMGPPALATHRVNQLDALRVNSEVVLLLQDMLLQCTRTCAPWLQRRQHELQLLLHLFLWAVSTARDKPTPGDLLQNVKYYGGEQLLQQKQLQQQRERLQQLYSDPAAAPDKLQQQQRVLLHLVVKQQHAVLQQQPLLWKHKLGLLLLHVLLPYAYQLLRQLLHRRRQQQQAAIEQRIRRFNVAQALRRQRMQQQQQHKHEQEEQQQQEQPKQQQQQQQKQQEQRQQHQQQHQQQQRHVAIGDESMTRLTAAEQSLECTYRCCMCVDLLLSLCRFLFFFYFLYRGRHRNLGDWLLGLEMRHIHPALRRSLSFELLQQQLYWQSLSHVLLLLLPHVDLLLLRRMLGQHLLTPARAAAAAGLLQLRQLLQPGHKLQQPNGGAPSPSLLRVSPGKAALMLLRSAKKRLTEALQEVGLLPHRLATAVEEHHAAKEPAAISETAAETETAADAGQSPVGGDTQPAPRPLLHLSPLGPPPPPSHEHHQQKQQQEQQQQKCEFCKRMPLLPFRSSNCLHVFCYWCVASHPEYRPGLWTSLHTDEQQLSCPTCGAAIRRIDWNA